MSQAAVKRYKVTGSGKVLTRKAGKQHLNEKKRHQHLLRCKCVCLVMWRWQGAMQCCWTGGVC